MLRETTRHPARPYNVPTHPSGSRSHLCLLHFVERIGSILKTPVIPTETVMLDNPDYDGCSMSYRCRFCSESHYCADCTGCNDCLACKACDDCDSCANCANCSNSANLVDCSRCGVCDNCVGCADCEDCEDCADCVRCDDCEECEGCTDCVRCSDLAGKTGWTDNKPPAEWNDMYEELSFDDYADEYARGYDDGWVGCFGHSGDWEYKPVVPIVSVLPVMALRAGARL